MPDTATIPVPWRSILTGLAALNYLLMATLGGYGASEWVDRTDHLAALSGLGLTAAAFVTVGALLCMGAKITGRWMVEWVALWFVMAGLVIYMGLEGIEGSWGWVAVEVFLFIYCAHRNVSLAVFAKDARWGADRRSKIIPEAASTAGNGGGVWQSK